MKVDASGFQLGKKKMPSSGTPSEDIFLAALAKDVPLSPGPSSTIRNGFPSLSSAPSSCCVRLALRLKGCPFGRKVNERTRQPLSSRVAATTAERLVPMLLKPMHTASSGLSAV